MILETISLDSELSVILLDQTRHYFGGYYHVKVLAYCDIPLKQVYFDNAADFNQAEAKLGRTVRFERTIEKMAVPEADIESVRNQLVRAFHETTKAYLAVPDFALRFVGSEYRKLLKKSPHTRSSRA